MIRRLLEALPVRRMRHLRMMADCWRVRGLILGPNLRENRSRSMMGAWKLMARREQISLVSKHRRRRRPVRDDGGCWKRSQF